MIADAKYAWSEACDDTHIWYGNRCQDLIQGLLPKGGLLLTLLLNNEELGAKRGRDGSAACSGESL